jgi:hypothetical protein
MRGLATLRIDSEIDPATQRLRAFRTRIGFQAMERTVWLDGREHPPPEAAHTFQGFSTGGIPFGERVALTEYFDTFKEPNGTEWFVVTTIVRDAEYLEGPWVTTRNFKREPDGSKFRPTACSAR